MSKEVLYVVGDFALLGAKRRGGAVQEMKQLFDIHKPVIGMLHAPALPASPKNRLPFDRIIEWVLSDADALTSGGVDALMIENFGDVPYYPGPVPAHTAAFLTALAVEIRRRFDRPLGINVLRNDAASAIAIAAASGAAFIRVNVHTGARLTDQGIIQGTAHETLRLRLSLGSDVKILADVDVKHSVPLAPRDLAGEVEETISRGGADAVIVTGSGTGKQTPAGDLKAAKTAAGPVPVFAGSGVDVNSVGAVLKIADGIIIGTALKKDGVSGNPVDHQRVRVFIEAVRQFRDVSSKSCD